MNDHFKFQSSFVNEVTKMVEKVYGIPNVLDNDCDAVLARVWFVQRNQIHSLCYNLL